MGSMWCLQGNDLYVRSTTLVTIGHLQVISEWPIVRDSKWIHARTFSNFPNNVAV